MGGAWFICFMPPETGRELSGLPPHHNFPGKPATGVGLARMRKTCGPDAFSPSLSITFILLQLLSTSVPGNGKADFTVFGPDKPVLAMVGADADLPCHLSLNISIEDMELRWYKDQPSQAMHVHKKGEDMQEEQMQQYCGRTSLVKAGLDQGQAVVRLYNISTLDNGTFYCHFKDGAVFQEAMLWLRVAGLGSEPTVHVRVDQDEGVWAECTSADWYPEPQVEWRDFRGQNLPSVTNLLASPTTGLWAVVSSMTVQQDRVVGGLFCSISIPLLSEKKVAKSLLPERWQEELGISSLDLASQNTSFGPLDSWANCVTSLCFVVGWREDGLIYVSPSLDPNTANPKLALSEDGKSVRRLPLEQELPDDPGQFDQDPWVLGQEQLSAGRYYWEVQVGRRKAWTLGVCLETLGRKGRVPKSPQHGIWALELYKKVLWSLDFPRVRLHPPEILCQVGILLDCDAGRVSFHHVADGSLVYVFTGLPFSAPLQPFFCLWTHDPNPLTVCSGHQPPEASDPSQGQGQERDRDLPPTGETLSAPVQPSWV
ncbi:LOW QUALITY PROTEIN: butyrophilin subfamily 1 member A1-like [Hipposideros larvatus]